MIPEDDDPAGLGADELNIEIETTTREQYVVIAHNAIQAVLPINTMTAEADECRGRIISNSMAIIDNIITELYFELYDD